MPIKCKMSELVRLASGEYLSEEFPQDCEDKKTWIEEHKWEPLEQLSAGELSIHINLAAIAMKNFIRQHGGKVIDDAQNYIEG